MRKHDYTLVTLCQKINLVAKKFFISEKLKKPRRFLAKHKSRFLEIHLIKYGKNVTSPTIPSTKFSLKLLKIKGYYRKFFSLYYLESKPIFFVPFRYDDATRARVYRDSMNPDLFLGGKSKEHHESPRLWRPRTMVCNTLISTRGESTLYIGMPSVVRPVFRQLRISTRQ